MRVSTNQTQDVAINAMLEQQEKLSKVQKQIATGKRIFKPSEDPIGAARVVDLRNILQTNGQYQKNIDAARARLTVEESIMGNATGILQRVRELAIAANNASQTNETRNFIAEEVDQLLEEILDMANSTDGSGDYLFAGSKINFRPFVNNANGEYEYQGDDTQRSLQIGPKRTIATSDSGNFVFRSIKDGNTEFTALENKTNTGSAIIDPGSVTGRYDGGTYAIIFDKQESIDPNEPTTYKVMNANNEEVIPAGTVFVEGANIEFNGVRVFVEGEPNAKDFFVIRPSENQDVFTTLKNFVDTLRIPRGDPKQNADLHNEINRTILGIDNSLGRVLEIRSNTGARLKALDAQESINIDYNLQIKEILSGIEDLDYAKAVSELNLKLTGLQASQKAFTRVQGISMFDYI
ncbi:hypothetical protein MNBD_GAMMA23-935 [hydrothermal vent metagenome]|uniref:Flagellin N-terminal domain-containing protein n=1 Tax=hydrothermal vent metagenome TaxID=652676 RepID=A0A3B1AXA9_9ZZZZ